MTNKRFRMPGWALFLAVGASWGIAFLAFPAGSDAQAVAYLGACISEVIAVFIGVRRHRPTGAAWLLLCAGVAVNCLANIAWFGRPVLLGQALPFPSVVDGLFMVAYTGVVAGLVSLIRGRTRGGERAAAWVDTSIITVAAGFVSWMYVLGPTASASSASPWARVAALAYPLFDIALVALAVRMLFTRGARPLSFWLLTGSIGAQLAGDVVFALGVLDGTFWYGQPWTAGWIVSFTLLGAAALHPGMRNLDRPAPAAARTTTSFVRVCVIAAAALLIPVMHLLYAGRASDELATGATAAVFVLAIVRMGLMVCEIHAKAATLEHRETDLTQTVDRLNRSEDKLAHQAHHDALTGLPNRVEFGRRLDRILASPGSRAAVMLLDLDNFKNVNDGMGHTAGDDLLVAVARRLAGSLRASDTIARFGGDEFTILAEGLGEQEADELATRVLAVLADPFVIEGSTVFCHASLGIAFGRGGVDIGTKLLRSADAAMYAAKRKGGGQHQAFTTDLQVRALDRLALECDLRNVALGTEMLLHYQPLVDLADGRLSGFEALLRWHHPQRGDIPPVDFIPIAEQTGAILPIGRWVLEEACRQVRAWQLRYPAAERLGVNVNVSARQLADASLVDDVRRVLEHTGLDPVLLTIEITETMIVGDLEEARECLVRLKALGVRISVDDFGTGYSSLGHLDRFPVDELKIDRSFVATMGTGEGGSGVAYAVIRLARSLDLDVVAEGIEEEVQVEALRRASCARGQGFFYSKALHPKSVESLLAELPKDLIPVDARPIVLVVDDDEYVRTSTGRILRGAGFETIEAGTGHEALRAARTFRIDALVLDVGLPDMDGYRVHDELRHELCSVPVLYLSGASVPDSRVSGRDAGTVGYLAKPVSPSDLLAGLRTCLSMPPQEPAPAHNEVNRIRGRSAPPVAETSAPGSIPSSGRSGCWTGASSRRS